jgi:hypothetical protein
MILLATTEDPAVIIRVLTHLGLSLEPASPTRRIHRQRSTGMHEPEVPTVTLAR